MLERNNGQYPFSALMKSSPIGRASEETFLIKPKTIYGFMRPILHPLGTGVNIVIPRHRFVDQPGNGEIRIVPSKVTLVFTRIKI